MNFKIEETEKSIQAMADLIIEIKAGQDVIINYLAAMEADHRDVSFEETMAEWASRTSMARTHLTEQLYAKYGPDLGSIDSGA